MPSICFYFQVHQPKRLRNYTIFDIGNSHLYEDDEANSTIMRKVAAKCYLPTNELMLSLIKRHQGRFRISYSITGVAIEQMKKYSPETLDSFKRLVDTGCVELISETYYHSLAYLYSKEEFIKQVEQHRELIFQEFGQRPTTFRNTELIYNNDLAKTVEELGYKTILAEGADKILDWRNANFVYHPPNSEIKVLLRNYSLADDIAFRFSNRAWEEHPLTAPKFSNWVHQFDGKANTINLFMDYETFGEHQWSDTGIFNFMEVLPDYIFKHPEFKFSTPSEVSKEYAGLGTLDVPDFMSWADMERDLSAWKGNHLQEDALDAVFALQDQVYQTGNKDLLNTWRSLQTSDHFYYMCTKWFSDGDVHKYFNPYESPYEAYINYQNILRDFEETLVEEITRKNHAVCI
ncbi:MAG: glycoside hydrolase family 57 protein [Cyanobacteria bacterium]|nr:glycoside hydrolase family 57 protein [Cyanobacteriota bacterium]MDA1021042.1 glycoside hydrolase family 57 protein [Cyanobacteriota bacterium]